MEQYSILLHFFNIVIMKGILFISGLIFSFVISYGQVNLVQNPSFEQYHTCPYNYSLVSDAYSWSAIVDTDYSLDTNFVYHGINGTIESYHALCMPYYCNMCDSINNISPGCWSSLPENAYFYHYPRTGNGLIFMAMYGNLGEQLGMYLQGRLTTPLVAGRVYCVSFYVVNTHWSGIGCNHIAAYFDDGIIDTTTECGRRHTEYAPQIVNESIITDTLNWTMIQGSFTATGTERFITIGNFDTTHTSIALFDSTGDPYEAVYLVDDVSVIAIDDTAYAGPDRVTSPGGDSVWVGDSIGSYLPCYWYSNVGGTGGTWHLADSNKAGFKVLPDSTTKYVMQLDVCGHVSTDTMTVYVYPLHLKMSQFEHLKIYPNPANYMINIVGASGCEVAFYDVVGSRVMATFVNSNKQTLDISSLFKGFYNVEVTDMETGERVVKKLVKE